MKEITVIIVAAGSGTRMGSEIPKQFLPVNGMPILVHTVRRFARLLPSAKLIVVMSPDNMTRWIATARQYDLPHHETCTGGATRFESVRNALESVDDDGIVLVHDGVRPVISHRLIHNVITTVSAEGTAIPAVEAVDSFREITGDGASKAVDRSRLRAVQTPQGFDAVLLKKAYSAPYDPAFTDDASVVERAGTPIALCRGDRANIKVTTPEDLAVAEILLRREYMQ